jgi:hypothetical protein
MKLKYTNARRYSWLIQIMVGVTLTGMLLAGCSFTGSSSNNSNTTQGGPASTSIPAVAHTISSKPSTGKLTGGHDLPANQILSRYKGLGLRHRLGFAQL